MIPYMNLDCVCVEREFHCSVCASQMYILVWAWYGCGTNKNQGIWYNFHTLRQCHLDFVVFGTSIPN